ncbi:MAG: hypothetical protein RRZ24_05760 [Clostridia bacterium]
MFDMNVLCVGQEVPSSTIVGNKNLLIENQNIDPFAEQKRYAEIAPFMNCVRGIWYDFRIRKQELAGTHFCDYIPNVCVHPYWIKSQSIQNDQGAVVVLPEYL